MGIDIRKSRLPAPTDSSIQQTSGEDVAGTELGTDISRLTDRTSYSIPEDGSPVTITTSKRRDYKHRDRENPMAEAAHPSQTSLLIEYFEGGKGPNEKKKPSVRVKVTPSKGRKNINAAEDRIEITEASNRKPSVTRRILLGQTRTGERAIEGDERSVSSYISAEEDSNLSRRPTIDVEVLPKDGSELSAPRDLSYIVNPSDISSMPPDPMVELQKTPQRSEGRSKTITTAETLKTPTRKDRSPSRERIAQKAAEKIRSGGKHKDEVRSRSRSVSKEHLESLDSPRRRSHKSRHLEEPSGTESSVLTRSEVSERRRSGDQVSFRSGTSKSSANNRKVIETVEDAIKRLILPELAALKLQQNKAKFERGHRDSYTSRGSSDSREEMTRRVSKHASAPDMAGKPKVVLNGDEHSRGVVLSGDSIKGRKEHRRDRVYSPSESSYTREMSEETVIRDEEATPKRSKGGSGLKGAIAGAIAGGVLTDAALKHHDSRSSVERRERRKRRSKSHSRSASIAESTDEIFQKHDVPPMPMRSEIADSELTRESLLSERTETPTEERRREIQEVKRGSPRDLRSPAPGTPTRSPRGKREYTAHSNLSRDNLSLQNPRSVGQYEDEHNHHKVMESALIGAAVGAGTVAASRGLDHHENNNEYVYNQHTQGRGLSPIQSVASFQEEDEAPNRDSFRQVHSAESFSSMERHQNKQNSMQSIKSESSLASNKFDHSGRPKGISLEAGEEVLEPHLRNSEYHEGDEYQNDNDWYDQQHKENDRYRDSAGEDSLDASYLDKVVDGQHVRDIGANAEYVRTPLAVESAVASLHDPSVMDVPSTVSGRSRFEERSYLDSPTNDSYQHEGEYQGRTNRDSVFYGAGSPLRQEFGHDDEEIHEGNEKGLGFITVDSPRQSIARSLNEEIPMQASALPIAGTMEPEIGHYQDSESEINTNPSEIRGPGGSELHENQNWQFQPTPPQSKGASTHRSGNNSAHESLKEVAAKMLSVAAGAGTAAALARRSNENNSFNEEKSRDLKPTVEDEDEFGQHLGQTYDPKLDGYVGHYTVPTPPGAKVDEGYQSGANPRSPDANTPNHKKNFSMFSDAMGGIDDYGAGDDPFTNKTHLRHLSGNSHGMASPLYDSATGHGKDRIQSKDIVALMDHLTVRDAQRNARDTEILVTLVRSAAEMRNSFEDLKRFIAEQDEYVIDTGNKQHDQTVKKVLGGPRPQPLGTPRVPRGASIEDDTGDDLPARKRNIFRRAMKGLSGRNSNDLARIEEMLERLLGDMEGLKSGGDLRPAGDVSRGNSYNSYENTRAVAQDGYEPEGQAGTSSTGNHSGYFSNPGSQQGSRTKGLDARRGSQNRVSTVLEGDEELDTHEQDVLGNQFEKNEQLLTPAQDTRGTSVPLQTPPQAQVATGAQSHENTPKTATDKSRKHKSSSSSFFPKMSRWSKTTASTEQNNKSLRASRDRPSSEASRSGSEIQNYNSTDHYDPNGDDHLRSTTSLQDDRPPSPLIPSQVSEKPAYEAHRNSVNLLHPQPRQGPTGRYQNHLESQAQTFGGSPISPSSDHFGSNPILARFNLAPGNRNSGAGHLSPISDAGYSDISAQGQSQAPARPPKIRDDGPLIPPRPPKIVDTTSANPTFAERSIAMDQEHEYESGMAQQANGSLRPNQIQVTARKPTGPRPFSGTYSPEKTLGHVKRNRYRGSPNHIDSDEEDVTF